MKSKILFLVLVSLLAQARSAFNLNEDLLACLKDMSAQGNQVMPGFLEKVNDLQEHIEISIQQQRDWRQQYPQVNECDINALGYKSIQSSGKSLYEKKAQLDMMVRSLEMCLSAKMNGGRF